MFASAIDEEETCEKQAKRKRDKRKWTIDEKRARKTSAERESEKGAGNRRCVPWWWVTPTWYSFFSDFALKELPGIPQMSVSFAQAGAIVFSAPDLSRTGRLPRPNKRGVFGKIW